MKPSVVDVFGGGDSDDEHEPRSAAAGRPPAASAAPVPASATGGGGGLPPDVAEAASKLAAFVAANGRHFEDLTRQRNSRDSPLGFLWDRGSAAYRQYARELARLEANRAGPRPTQPVQPTLPVQLPAARPGAQPQPAGPPQLSSCGVGAKRSRWSDAPPPPAMQPPAEGPGPGGAPAPRTAAGGDALAAGAPGGAPSSSGGGPGTPGGGGPSTLAAMDAYMARLAEREREAAARDADSDEERRRRAEPLLKETAFDRRKTTAVFRSDGSRGHHMGDYIPPEELAKFMESCGDKEAAARAAAQAPGGLSSDNIGHRLLAKMGWREGQGLGASQQGAAAPVAVKGAPAAAGGGGGLGLGAAPSGAVEEGDDEFTRYRKRSNPRKKYW